MIQRITSKIDAAIIWALYNTININSPIDTGNLRYNGIKFERIGDGKWKIWVDADTAHAIAFYMKYTNEDWNNFKPPLYGKKNPNQGWWNRETENFINMLAETLGGAVQK